MFEPLLICSSAVTPQIVYLYAYLKTFETDFVFRNVLKLTYSFSRSFTFFYQETHWSVNCEELSRNMKNIS